MRRIFTSLLLGFAAALSGCSTERTTPDPARETRPFGGLGTVAIAPITANRNVDTASIPFDVSNEFASEVARYGAAQLLRPDYVQRYMRANGITLRSDADVIDLGKRLGADLVITVHLTDWYAYNPPRVAANVAAYSTSSAAAANHDEIERWMTSGVATPMAGGADPAMPVFAAEMSIDASFDETFEKLKDYAALHRNKETSFNRSGSALKRAIAEPECGDYLNVMAKYFRFASDQMIQAVARGHQAWRLDMARREADRLAEIDRELSGNFR